MKIFFYLFLSIILIYGVYGAVGGEVVTIFEEPNCVGNIDVTVNGTETIDVGEYWLLGCTQMDVNQWICDCPKVELETMVNTVNHYIFYIEFFYQAEEQSSGGGGGGRSRRYYYIITEDNVTKQEIDPEIVPTEPEPTEEDELDGTVEPDNEHTGDNMDSVGDLNPVDTNIGTDEGSEERKEEVKKVFSAILFIGLIVVSLIIIFVIGFNRYKVYWEE